MPLDGCGLQGTNALQLTVQTEDAGVLPLGAQPLSGLNYGKWESLGDAGQETAYFSGGTVTLGRADSRSAGSFTTTLLESDGGTSSLSGTWDGVVCPL